ncbi:MAG: glutamine--fructose-6-phosphate transaminase (isomerizing) [Candidatus Caenarcaniphilales bacterium]|nr:glutamine--fructose-6-phosphate transaminase (isomerizing) [Candidatus Caenarcaniphilales bacterium]
MCGIVGYIGDNQALDFLLDSLKILEYRGYDSSGVAVYDPEKGIKIKKAKGKLSNLVNLTADKGLRGSLGIGHTRWATQGVPSDLNAHPHSNGDCTVAIVHNGIINNYFELKRELIERHQIEFSSETDSEMIAHLVWIELEAGVPLREAVQKVSTRLVGSYALCVISKHEPDRILLSCHEAPLVIGKGADGALFCASDSMALMPYTNEIIRLKDKHIAELRQDGSFQIFDEKGKLIDPHVQVLTTDAKSLDRGGYKHYLLKEIHEQPNIIRQLLEHHCDSELNLSFPSLRSDLLSDINRVLILGCGTAYYAGMVGRFLLESLAQIHTECEFSSELLARPVLADQNTLVIAISQSGETADTLLAVKAALSKGARLLAITNRPDSTLASLAEEGLIYTQAGIEVSVAATKSFSAQLLIMYLLALRFAEQNQTLTVEKLTWIKRELRFIPQIMEQVLARAESYKTKILPFASKKAFIFLGRGLSYPIALEGALKLKEITYIQSTGYAAGEMKHGPIATIDEEVPTLSILLPGQTFHKTLHNALEAKTRGAPSLGIVVDDDQEATGQLDVTFPVPNLPFSSEFPEYQDLFTPFVAVIPLQLIAYHMAEHLGKDVDQPRNLAKSVTVE